MSMFLVMLNIHMWTVASQSTFKKVLLLSSASVNLYTSFARALESSHMLKDGKISFSVSPHFRCRLVTGDKWRL